MADETLQDMTEKLSGLTLEQVSEIKASLTEDGKIPETLILGLHSSDLQIQRTAATTIRTIQAGPPIINAGLLPTLVLLLDSDDGTLQSEAAWIVLNIASGTTQQATRVVEAGAIPKLITLSASPIEDVSENAVWALANIIGDSASLRDHAEAEGVVEAFVRLLNDPDKTPHKIQRRVVWGICNFLIARPGENPSAARENPPKSAPLEEDKGFIQEAFLSLADALQCLERILDLGHDRPYVIETGVVPRLVHIISDSSYGAHVQRNALRCIAFLTDGEDEETDVAVEAGLLPALLVHTLEGTHQELCRVALWSASNIAAGSLSQAHALLDCGLLKSAVRILMDSWTHYICRQEACWIVSNLSTTFSGDLKVRKALIEERGVEGLLAALGVNDKETREIALSGITGLLECQDSHGSWVADSFSAVIRALDGPQKLCAIWRSPREDKELRGGCHRLLARYFPEYSKRARV
ncbi:Importin subunit alpha-4 [Tulasnella sp. 417]|nr:Importin subunit alpha-4 [Tulasnella sp. 417]